MAWSVVLLREVGSTRVDEVRSQRTGGIQQSLALRNDKVESGKRQRNVTMSHASGAGGALLNGPPMHALSSQANDYLENFDVLVADAAARPAQMRRVDCGREEADCVW